jgi:hypothetical protein
MKWIYVLLLMLSNPLKLAELRQVPANDYNDQA